ncbi:MAG TPA: PhoPQ-activated protein PqaA family protein, partial [Candidatus Hydrogenedentes bacterium]|nr:PhoPQ-activated protein PqaA family protein [Candidatus Hydrogenedentota bacterium]
MKIRFAWPLSVCLIAWLCAGALAIPAAATPLDDYVAVPDASYSYSIQSSAHVGAAPNGYTRYVVRLNSQTWRSSSELNRTLWQHWLTIVVPDTLLLDTAMLVINGGSNGDGATDLEPYLGYIVSVTGSVMAFLEQVPNQPLRSLEDNISRSEDHLIAWSFDKYLSTGDATWPVLLPMVKSAVRAMDTIAAIAAGHGVTADKFVVGGGSKRGWTTWLTTAVDPRIVACAPVVIDVLNMQPSMEHHWKCYGAYSSAVHDYVDYNIFDRMDTPEGAALRAIVDPYVYRERFTMPKFMVNATGDEFFVLDSAQFYFHDLPGVKHLYYAPNSGHGMDVDISSIASLIVYYMAIARNDPLPRFSWTFEGNNSIRVETEDPVDLARLWQATNPDARDFRWYSGAGPHWTGTTLTEQTPGSGVYVAQVAMP